MPFERGSYTCLPQKPSNPNLLEKPLKDFIVNLADLSWMWVKMYNLCRVLKTGIPAVLINTSGLDSL
jgi:hypothetical protein